MVMWLNAFPVKSGISTTYSLWKIMNGKILYWAKLFKAEFGSCCEVHKEHSPMTKNRVDYAHTCSAICLGTTSKFQGSYTFLCLKTGKCINLKQFSVVPMPDSVVKWVEELAIIDAQLDEDLTFEYWDNITLNYCEAIKWGLTCNIPRAKYPNSHNLLII